MAVPEICNKPCCGGVCYDNPRDKRLAGARYTRTVRDGDYRSGSAECNAADTDSYGSDNRPVRLGVNLVRWLLGTHTQKTYMAILGLMIGSILTIYPGFEFNLTGIISILVMLACGVISYLFARTDK